jgi:hypothetical protein
MNGHEWDSGGLSLLLASNGSQQASICLCRVLLLPQLVLKSTMPPSFLLGTVCHHFVCERLGSDIVAIKIALSHCFDRERRAFDQFICLG